MGPYKVSGYSTTEGEKGFGNRDYEATTTFSVTLSIDATRLTRVWAAPADESSPAVGRLFSGHVPAFRASGDSQ